MLHHLSWVPRNECSAAVLSLKRAGGPGARGENEVLVHRSDLKWVWRGVGVVALASVALTGCKKDTAGAAGGPAAGGPPRAMPVQVQMVAPTPLANTDTYVATIKGRRSATMQPQVEGNLTRILVKSGDRVKAGQVLMTIDPLKQQATVQQQLGTEAQQKAI